MEKQKLMATKPPTRLGASPGPLGHSSYVVVSHHPTSGDICSFLEATDTVLLLMLTTPQNGTFTNPILPALKVKHILVTRNTRIMIIPQIDGDFLGFGLKSTQSAEQLHFYMHKCRGPQICLELATVTEANHMS